MAETRKVRVAVNGYGVIGKRVAAAVASQQDMVLTGVSDVVTDWRAQAVLQNNYQLFGATADSAAAMRDAGLDALQLVGRMQRTLNTQGSHMEILAASVRTPEEVEDLAELGVATATLPWKVLSSLLESDATDAAAATFLEDAGAIQ